MSPKSWIAVASAEHVRLGRSQGFMQVCHGKAAPLRRITPGDAVAYYSPTEILRMARTACRPSPRSASSNAARHIRSTWVTAFVRSEGTCRGARPWKHRSIPCLDTFVLARQQELGLSVSVRRVRDTARGSAADRGRDGRETPRCWPRRGNRFAASPEPLAYRGSISPRAHPARVVRAKLFERAASRSPSRMPCISCW